MTPLTINNSTKYALITGATSGLGYEFAKLFAQEGYNLILVARSKEKLQEVADILTETFNVEVTPLAKDLFNPTSAIEIYLKTREMGIHIDTLINDAGQEEYGKFIEYGLARDIDIIQLNITSMVSLTKYFLKDMVSHNEGKVLQVASGGSQYPTPLATVYAATKAFVLSFTEGLINELKDTKVITTALIPGSPDADFFYKGGIGDTSMPEADMLNVADVAKEGYEALLRGESRIISGFKTRMEIGS